MLAVGFLQWWYTRGWKVFAQGLLDKIHNIADFFSIRLLLRTLFTPFRQISAYADGNTIQAQIGAFFDKLLSRVIGAIVRVAILIAGMLAICADAIISIVLVCAWPFFPLFPICAVILAVIGVAL